MRAVARELVTATVSPSFRLDLADYPSHLPLVGAALGHKDSSAAAALVYDFGGSSVKRGYASYNEEGGLAGIRLLPPQTLEATADPWEGRPEYVRNLGEAMSRLIAADWRSGRAAGLKPSPEVACAVNGYVDADEPSDVYSAVRHLDGSADWLSGAVSRRAAEALSVRLSHDGTAAARSLAGRSNAAVIMLGTWIGVGFPPARGAVRPLAPHFRVEQS
jgi:hypothetical protein